ncbi:MAG: hypothetical protein L6R38_006220 [Xanthoria sp. 2 TBL-2021]|nr:MAG: hypothetical protein L6R38_006220 [Xanthoria sp. 2 TBL-2021]
MYPSQLLTTLSLFTLPLTILSAPAPVPAAQLELPKGPAVYYIQNTKSTSRGGRLILLETSGHWIVKDFTITVKGDTPGAVERRCTGTLTWEGSDEDLAKQQTAMLNCAEDPQVKVGVTTSAGLSAAETYSVQDRDFPVATTPIQPNCDDDNGVVRDTYTCVFSEYKALDWGGRIQGAKIVRYR